MIALMIEEGFSPLDAFYFIIVTIATVGYGDLHPVTPLGKMTVIIIILFGVGVFIGLVANSIEYLIDKRERAERLKKMNMIVGVLFSELGIRLLKAFGGKDPAIGEIRAALVVADKWSEDDFKRAYGLLENHTYAVKSQDFNLEHLRDCLKKREDFMIRLLENPELLEQEAFTELMQALFHLNEELGIRERLTGLPQSDYNHLSVDINRAYRHLALVMAAVYAAPESTLSLSLLACNESQPVRSERITDSAVMRDEYHLVCLFRYWLSVSGTRFFSNCNSI